jgi:hypothetical protein
MQSSGLGRAAASNTTKVSSWKITRFPETSGSPVRFEEAMSNRFMFQPTLVPPSTPSPLQERTTNDT